MSLKIVSHNCQSVNINFDIIKLLSQNCDILLLQENNNILLGGINHNLNYALFKTYTSSFYYINLWFGNDIKHRNI